MHRWRLLATVVALLTINTVIADEEYAGYDPTGGVSKEKKIKIEDTFKMDDCGMVSNEDDTIHWNYKGYLLDGHVFDEGKFTATLGHHHVITGVDVGMRGLCVGDKRKMTIHSDWAYGDNGIKGTIPEKATLIFDVELTSIERPGSGVETLEDILKKTGGVSKTNKIKLEDIYKVDAETCKLQSQEDDTIHWNYKGYLLDGHVFDEGKFIAKLGHHQVITGVDVGMRGLCVGDKRKMTIHSGWAYGDNGIKGTIPEKATLIFDVELTSIERADGQKQTLEDLKEQVINKMGGVSKDNKLKIDITHAVKDCEIRSQQDDTIYWNYKGTFLDGSEFHSGDFYATLGHGHVIEGVDKGMRDLCTGDKRRLIIHPDWAYGDEGRPGSIPPKSVLVFDVEVTDVKRPDSRKAEL